MSNKKKSYRYKVVYGWYFRGSRTPAIYGDCIFSFDSEADELSGEYLRKQVQKDMLAQKLIPSATSYEDNLIDFRYFDVSWERISPKSA